jgi:hypothetical protein
MRAFVSDIGCRPFASKRPGHHGSRVWLAGCLFFKRRLNSLQMLAKTLSPNIYSWSAGRRCCSAPQPALPGTGRFRDRYGSPLDRAFGASRDVRCVRQTRSSVAREDLLCHLTSGIKRTQVRRAIGPIFALSMAYRCRTSSSSIRMHR